MSRSSGPSDRRYFTRVPHAFAARYLDPGYDLTEGFTSFLSPAGCRVWHVGRAAAVQNEPVSSVVPTLVLAGEFDGGVPPYVVRQVDAGLSRSYYYDFPGGAHGQLASFNNDSDCARTIAGEFLANPAVTPDSSCIADIPPLDFSP